MILPTPSTDDPRVQFDPECEACVRNEGKMAPPHSASPFCHSGGANHCSCSRCF